MGKNYTNEQIATLENHLAIDKFRNNPMVNNLPQFPSVNSVFIGQGKIGGCKDVVPPLIDREIDEWIVENKKNLHIPFPSQ